MKTQKLTFYCDSGHGWLEVPRADAVALGLADKISPWSYIGGQSIYLEEDCDLPIFLNKMEKHGKKITFIEEHSNTDSWVRNLQRFEWGFK